MAKFDLVHRPHLILNKDGNSLALSYIHITNTSQFTVTRLAARYEGSDDWHHLLGTRYFYDWNTYESSSVDWRVEKGLKTKFSLLSDSSGELKFWGGSFDTSAIAELVIGVDADSPKNMNVQVYGMDDSYFDV